MKAGDLFLDYYGFFRFSSAMEAVELRTAIR